MRTLFSVAIALVLLTASSRAEAGSYLLHLQGRSQGGWVGNTIVGQRMPLADIGGYGWTNKTFDFNGSARIASTETDSTTNTTSVNYALRTYCGTGTGNSCIVHCYSTGCFRALKAIDDIRAGVGGSANSLAGLLYMEASGNAAGGTDIAELSTSKWTGWIAKLFGQQEAVDKDLTRSAARTTFSYIHDSMPVQLWHVAGNLNICKKLLGPIKICSPIYIAGTDDGVVPWASSGGYSSSSARTSMCNSGVGEEQNTGANVPNKYPKHRTDTYWIDCDGTAVGSSTTSWDHFGIPDVAEAIIEGDIRNASSVAYNYWKWGDTTSDPDCSGASCDNAFYSTVSTDMARYNDGTATAAPSTDAFTSQTYTQTGSTTSCLGRCGTAPVGYCACTAGAAVKCADYTTVKCNYVNQ